MARRDLELRIGIGLAVMMQQAGFIAAGVMAFVLLHPGRPGFGTVDYVLPYALVLACGQLAVVVHELGHFLAARLTGAPVTSIQIGGRAASVGFRVRTVKIQLGLGATGHVVHGPTTAARSAVILAAGPAADILAGVVLLIVPLHAAIRFPAALVFAIDGMASLLPYRSRRTGRLSDGARLFRGPRERRAQQDVRALLATNWKAQPDAADRLLRGIQFGVPAAEQALSPLAGLLMTAGRIDDLLWLHRKRVTLPATPPYWRVDSVHALEWAVASIPDLPLADANRAGRRMQWVIKHSSAQNRPIAEHTLAVVRLRQGLPSEIADLCAPLLASSAGPSRRASVLATLAMARHAGGLSGREALAEALELDPEARLVQEAASRLAAPAAG